MANGDTTFIFGEETDICVRGRERSYESGSSGRRPAGCGHEESDFRNEVTKSNQWRRRCIVKIR